MTTGTTGTARTASLPPLNTPVPSMMVARKRSDFRTGTASLLIDAKLVATLGATHLVVAQRRRVFAHFAHHCRDAVLGRHLLLDGEVDALHFEEELRDL